MPIFTPSRRWQPPYLPFARASLLSHLLAAVERVVKGVLFSGRMGGNFLLEETAFICPMDYPNGSRKSLCGGSTPERCSGDPTRPFIWHRIYERYFPMGREERLLEVIPPLDWDQVGTETWGDVARQGAHGIHLMAAGREEIIPRIVTKAGLHAPASTIAERSPAPAAGSG